MPTSPARGGASEDAAGAAGAEGGRPRPPGPRVGQSHAARLTPELLGDVLSYLGSEELRAAEEVSRQLRSLCRERHLWQQLFRSRPQWSCPPPFLKLCGDPDCKSAALLRPGDADCRRRVGGSATPPSVAAAAAAEEGPCRCEALDDRALWKIAYHKYGEEAGLRVVRRRSASSCVVHWRIGGDRPVPGSRAVFTCGAARRDTAGPVEWVLDVVRDPRSVDAAILNLAPYYGQKAYASGVAVFLTLRIPGTPCARVATVTFENRRRWHLRLRSALLQAEQVVEIDLTLLDGTIEAAGPRVDSARRLVTVRPPPPREGSAQDPGEPCAVGICTASIPAWQLLAQAKTKSTVQAGPIIVSTADGEGGDALEWFLSLQPSSTNGFRDTWVAVSQPERTCAFFIMRVLDPCGQVLAERCTLHYFPGCSAAARHLPKGGCRFPLELFKGQGRRLELSVAPCGGDGVKCINTGFGVTMGRCAELQPSPDLLHGCVHSLGVFVSERRMEQTVQRRASTDVQSLFCSAHTPPRLRAAASAAMWNILDYSPIGLHPDQVKEIARTVAQHLELLAGDGGGAAPPYETQGVEGRVRLSMARSLSGVISNLSAYRPTQLALVAQPGLLASVLRLLGTAQLWEAHFSCLNTLTMAHMRDLLPEELAREYRRLVRAFCDHESPCDRPKFNMRISPRDVADFFFHQIKSPKLECVRFGSWCIELMYFTDAWHGDRAAI